MTVFLIHAACKIRILNICGYQHLQNISDEIEGDIYDIYTKMVCLQIKEHLSGGG